MTKYKVSNIKYKILANAALLVFSACIFADSNIMPAHINKIQKQKSKAIENWQDLRFGLFIHWGPVSIKGTEIGWSRGEQVPSDEYDNLYKQFNPEKFNAAEWVSTAKNAGMKYLVITSKHHDGFCLWDTKFTDYKITSSPYKIDILKELQSECEEQGIKFGVYYSICDWRHKDYPMGSPGGRSEKSEPNMPGYVTYMKNQLREILTNYGKVSILWFDGGWEKPWTKQYSDEVYNLVRKTEPGIIINDRLGHGNFDYHTPEQFIGNFNRQEPWESCFTICQQWAWKPNDRLKSLKECIDILVKCAGGDGNLLLNVGPMPDGRIEPRQVERLLEIGKWLEKNGDSIYRTRGGPFKPGRWGASTYKGNRIYLHILNWQGKETLTLPSIDKKILKSSLVGGDKVNIEKNEAGINVTVPKQYQDRLDTIVVLEIDSDAGTIEPIDVIFRSGSLAAGKKATASNVFENQAGHNADKAFDDDFDTRWATDFGVSKCWLEADLGETTSFNMVMIDEAYAGRVKSFELQFKVDEQWKTFYKGDGIGENFTAAFEPVKARYIRLYINEATEGPTINEFQIFAGKENN